VIFGIILYVGYQFGEVQWRYFNFREKVFELISLAVSARRLDHDLYKKTLVQKGAEAGFEIDQEDIKIIQDEKDVTFEIYWEAPIEFPFYTYYREFEIEATRKKGL
jgi:hypothetical protein